MTAKKLPYRTPLDEPKVTITPSGEKIENVLAMKLGDNGEEEFYISGQTNIYEKIQAHAEECKIENILAAVTEGGDAALLNQRQGMYLDISEYPGNIFEAHQRIKEAEKIFRELPIETREKYDHNFDKFLRDFGSDNWLNNMGLIKANPEEHKEEKEAKEE